MDPEPYFWQVFLLHIFQPLTPVAIAELLGLLVLLLCSALASGAEVAYFSLSPGDKEKLAETGNNRSTSIQNLLRKPEKLLATILITNNFINIGVVILSSHLTNLLFNFQVMPDWTVLLIQVVLITFLLLLFGEILPKIYASRASLAFANFTVYPLQVAMRLFSPISHALIRSTSFFNRKLKKKQNISVEDLSDALELTKEDITENKSILKGIVTFGSIDAKEIMKPRVDVVAADTSFHFNKLKSLIVESGYSRIPVYEKTFDEIRGVLIIKDLLPHLDKEEFAWQNLLRSPFFVPETMKINDLLEEFRKKKRHLAIIIDEYGGFTGIVTLEDIIEEIVGEISDEKDTSEEELFHKINDQTYIFDAKIQLNDLYKILKTDGDIFQENRGESDSLAGLILEKKGEIPKKQEIIQIQNYSFEILAADNRKIKKVKLTINEE
ncbi:MAG: hemolysin [Bacteroidia bacterium]|nr:MAG: hemolysin [Bacteroidia bacterium]